MLEKIGTMRRQYRTKFSRTGILGQFLGFNVKGPASQKHGLVILQVDGLSREQFEAALSHGKLPFLRKLIRGEYFRRVSFYSGLPSSTPAVQAEVMYGVKSAVPAFQFLHRSTGQIFRMFEGEAARTIVDELPDGAEPLLKGGASYSNIYSGGSDDAQCCAETRSLSEMLRQIRPFQFLLTMFLYSFTLVRIAALSAVELLVAVGDMLRGLFSRRDWQNEVKFVPMRVLISIILREWVRIVVKLSIASGTPVIYANLLGYDEQAHRRGPSSAFAHWGLKGIDGVIKDIFRAAKRSDQCNYEIVVFSDHGQEAVRIYDFEYGKMIQEAVADSLRFGPLASRMVMSVDTAMRQGGQTDQWMSNTLRIRRSQLNRRVLTEKELVDNVIVTALGPLGHIYFPLPVTDEAKADCAARLVLREHVPLVLYQLGNHEVWGRNSRGLWRIPDDCSAICGTDHRFIDEISQDLLTLVSNQNSGDLIISGWDPDAQPLTFVKEHGSHGSVGYQETRGFALMPRCMPVSLRKARNGESYIRGVDLHDAALSYLHPARASTMKSTLPLIKAATADSSDPARRSTLGITTYNTHHCVGMDGRCRPDRIAQVIADSGADAIALQEMDENRARTDFQNQSQMIASRLGMYYRFFPVLHLRDERYGLAIISRFPITPVREEVFSRTRPSTISEARGAMWVSLRTDAGPIHMLNTHLGLRSGERSDQINQLLGNGWLDAIPDDDPVIICGDLNAGPKSEVMQRLRERFYCVQTMAASHTPQATFASMLPIRRIDHILVSRHFEVRSVSVVKNYNTRLASDHLPLHAELELRPGDRVTSQSFGQSEICSGGAYSSDVTLRTPNKTCVSRDVCGCVSGKE